VHFVPEPSPRHVLLITPELEDETAASCWNTPDLEGERAATALFHECGSSGSVTRPRLTRGARLSCRDRDQCRRSPAPGPKGTGESVRTHLSPLRDADQIRKVAFRRTRSSLTSCGRRGRRPPWALTAGLAEGRSERRVEQGAAASDPRLEGTKPARDCEPGADAARQHPEERTVSDELLDDGRTQQQARARRPVGRLQH